MGSSPHAVRAMVVRITPWQTYSRNRRAARRKADGRAQSVTTSVDVVKARRSRATNPTNTATKNTDQMITLAQTKKMPMQIHFTSRQQHTRMSMTNGWFGREEGSACCSLSSAARSLLLRSLTIKTLLGMSTSMIHTYHSWRAAIHIQDSGCCKRRSTAKTVATATPGPLADGEKFTAKAMQRKVQVELRYAKAATLPIYSILTGESGLSSFTRPSIWGGSLVLLLSNRFCDTFMSFSVAPTTFSSPSGMEPMRSGPAISSVTFAAASSVAVSSCLAPTTSPCTLEVFISGPCVSSTFSSPGSASAGCMW